VEEVPEKHFAIHDVFFVLKAAKSNRFDQEAITKTNKIQAKHELVQS
jgi:hypothetical protein